MGVGTSFCRRIGETKLVTPTSLREETHKTSVTKGNDKRNDKAKPPSFDKEMLKIQVPNKNVSEIRDFSFRLLEMIYFKPYIPKMRHR